MSDMRACPACGQPQEWCDRPGCASVGLPVGHWTHMGPSDCRNLGDRNRVPGAPPDNVYTRGLLADD